MLSTRAGDFGSPISRLRELPTWSPGTCGGGAVCVLGSHGIEVIRGASGDARKAVEAFVRGTLSDSGLGCSGHGSDADHRCGNH